MAHRLRLGSRQSALAMKQAEMVKKALLKENPNLDIEIIGISTQGDDDKTSPLSEIGGKGVFIKTLEIALLNNTIDIAVHSLKDVTSTSPEELVLTGFLKPEAIEDVLITPPESGVKSLEELPKNAVIGTGSLRRRALLKSLRADLKTVELRGNIETRIEKCFSGSCDAILLSKVGLLRMGWRNKIADTLDPFIFVPAPGQGVIALQSRKGDALSEGYAQMISDPHQSTISRLEMGILTELGLDCRYPFGLYTEFDGNRFAVTAFWSDMDFKKRKKETVHFLKKDQSSVVASLINTIKTDFTAWGVYG